MTSQMSPPYTNSQEHGLKMVFWILAPSFNHQGMVKIYSRADRFEFHGIATDSRNCLLKVQ